MKHRSSLGQLLVRLELHLLLAIPQRVGDFVRYSETTVYGFLGLRQTCTFFQMRKCLRSPLRVAETRTPRSAGRPKRSSKFDWQSFRVERPRHLFARPRRRGECRPSRCETRVDCSSRAIVATDIPPQMYLRLF